MASGSMWWMKSDWIGAPPPGVTLSWTANGLTFTGTLITAPLPFLQPDQGPWTVELRSYYFLDPARMPATGEPFISLPKVDFRGSFGLSGGAGKGHATCFMSVTQSLRPGGVEVASSYDRWLVGQVYFGNVIQGSNFLAARKRDCGALFFNLDAHSDARDRRHDTV